MSGRYDWPAISMVMLEQADSSPSIATTRHERYLLASSFLDGFDVLPQRINSAILCICDSYRIDAPKSKLTAHPAQQG